MQQNLDTAEPRFNEPLYNVALDIVNDFLNPNNSNNNNNYFIDSTFNMKISVPKQSI